MKASNILRSAQGLIAGALVRLDDATTRIESLQKVADDIASGVTPIDGMSKCNAEALSMCLTIEADLARTIAEQIRTGYALLIACASSLPPPHPDAVDLTCGDEITISFEA